MIGSEISGKKFMTAAIFDPTQEHLVKLHNKVPVPDVSPKHALVEIKAAALKYVYKIFDLHETNRVHLMLLLYSPSNYKLNLAMAPFVRHLRLHVVGYDFAGKVLSVGTDPSCKHLKVGDEVYGLCPSGSFAEFGSCICRAMAKKPKSLSFQQVSHLRLAIAIGLSLAFCLLPDNNLLVFLGGEFACCCIDDARSVCAGEVEEG